MNPVFNSKRLSGSVFYSELETLNPKDQQIVYDEAIEAINSIDASIKEINDLEKMSGVGGDSDWLHRARKKRRICLEFAAKLNTILNGTEPPKVSYEESYKKHLRAILLEELGPDLERIEQEAAELARSDVLSRSDVG